VWRQDKPRGDRDGAWECVNARIGPPVHKKEEKMSNTYCAAIPQHTSSSLDLKAILEDGEILAEALGKILEDTLKINK
jgi:hypothetical protein